MTNPQCTVIGGKTLDTGAPGERVAILASRDDLDLLMDSLASFLPYTHKVGRDKQQLHDALYQLRRKAFGL